MTFKVILSLVLVNLVSVGVVKGHIQQPVPNEALDQSLYEDVLDPEQCLEQINIIRNNTYFALFFADAGIRVPRGILEGNMIDMGNYHQCIGFNQPIRPNTEIQGKYCMIQVPMDQTLDLPWEIPMPSNFNPNLLRMDGQTVKALEEMKASRTAMHAAAGFVDDRTITDNPLAAMTFRLAICIPKPCTTEQALNSFLFNISSVGFEYIDEFCRLADDKPWVSGDTVAVVVFSLIGLITVLSTTFDIWQTKILKKDPITVSVIGRAFSVYTNGRRVMNFQSSPNSIESLDGIRALAMMWVVLGHSFSSEAHWANPLDAFLWMTSWQALWVLSATVIVDTFFMLSGFLVVYTTVGKINWMTSWQALWVLSATVIVDTFFMLSGFLVVYTTVGKINWMTSWQALWVLSATVTVDTFFMLSGFLVVYTTVGKINSRQLFKKIHLFWLNRLLRMFPLLATAVLLETTFLNRATDGPIWTVVEGHVERCRTSWWATLLHMQNYMNPTNTCVGQTWYLAIDVQLHVLSPLMLFWVLLGNKRIAWAALFTGLIGILVASTTFNFIMEFPSTMMGRPEDTLYYSVNYYMNTLTRGSPFFVGMLFGYIVKTKKLVMSKIVTAIYWIAAFSLSTFIVYSNYPIGQPDWDNQLVDSLYNSFIRPLWALFVGCIVFACVNGYAGPINWFLSLNVWKLQSRMSYGIYLFHFGLMTAVNTSAIAPAFFSVRSVVFKFLAHYTLAFIFTFAMVVVIDAPCSTLFKLLLGGQKKPIKKEEDEEPNKDVEKTV